MHKVSSTIRRRILEDNEFSNQLASQLGIQQQSVIGLAKRNSDKLTLYHAIEYYKKKGFKEDEIFEFAENKNHI